MKKNNSAKPLIISIAVMLMLIVIFILLIDRHEENAKTEIPFSTLDWSSDYEDMTAADGELFVTYASSGGTTYQYIKEYLNKTGYLKYHFSDSGELIGIAWSYEASDKAEMEALYDTIFDSLAKKYGEGRTSSSGTSIRLNTGFGGSDTSLQYFFINPDAL